MLQDALNAALRPTGSASLRPMTPPGGVLVLGATGRLGAAVLDALLGRRRFHPVQVVVNAGISAVPRGLEPVDVATIGMPPLGTDERGPPPPAAGGPATALLLFDRGADRLGRDRVFHAPEPRDLLQLGRHLRARGVRRLLVLTPLHERTLPEGLRRGLAGLDEQALAALGFEQLVFVRPAAAAMPEQAAEGGLWDRVARVILGQLHWMVPVTQRPLRQRDVAGFVLDLLALWDAWPPGTRVATAETLWAWARPDGGERLLDDWGRGRPLPAARAPRPW